MAEGIQREARRQRREVRLASLGFPTYQAYLNSPAWRALRESYRASGLPQRCLICTGSFDVLHHRTYETIGSEALDDVAPLCRPCHELIHELERRGDSGLDPAELVDRLGAPTAAPTPEVVERDRDLKREIRSLAMRLRRGLEGQRPRSEFARRHAKRVADQVADQLMKARDSDVRPRLEALEEIVATLPEGRR